MASLAGQSRQSEGVSRRPQESVPECEHRAQRRDGWMSDRPAVGSQAENAEKPEVFAGAVERKGFPGPREKTGGGAGPEEGRSGKGGETYPDDAE